MLHTVRLCVCMSLMAKPVSIEFIFCILPEYRRGCRHSNEHFSHDLAKASVGLVLKACAWPSSPECDPGDWKFSSNTSTCCLLTTTEARTSHSTRAGTNWMEVYLSARTYGLATAPPIVTEISRCLLVPPCWPSLTLDQCRVWGVQWRPVQDKGRCNRELRVGENSEEATWPILTERYQCVKEGSQEIWA